MQQPLSRQHDSPGKWILISKGWCPPPPPFFSPTLPPPISLSLSLSLSRCFALFNSLPPSTAFLSLCLSVCCHAVMLRCAIKHDGWLELILGPRSWSRGLRTPDQFQSCTCRYMCIYARAYMCVCVWTNESVERRDREREICPFAMPKPED